MVGADRICLEDFKEFLYIGRIKGNVFTPYEYIVSGRITYGDMFVKDDGECHRELYVYYADDKWYDKPVCLLMSIPKEKYEKGETHFVEIRNKNELSLHMFNHVTSLDIIKEFFTVKEIVKYEVKPKWVD